MDSLNSICQSYHHLNLEERIILQTYKKESYNITNIARKLGRSKVPFAEKSKEARYPSESVLYYIAQRQLSAQVEPRKSPILLIISEV